MKWFRRHSRNSCINRCVVSLVVFFVVVSILFTQRKSQSKLKHLKQERLSKARQFLQLRSSADQRYKIWDNVIISKDKTETFDLGIATQTSLNNIQQIVELTASWNGPISISVFVTGSQFRSLKLALHYLVQCHGDIFEKLSLHLVIPLSHPPEEDVLDLKELESPNIQHCQDLKHQYKGKNYDRRTIPYPVNLLRNVALHSLQTSYVMVVDVDMVPSWNLYEYLLQNKDLLSTPRRALVIPAFEMILGTTIPKSKNVLLSLWGKGLIRPFYEQVCNKCQFPTNYAQWKTNNDVIKGYQVTWRDSWEPFYVSKKSSVVYDERFERYGFNRISQLCHLHMQGFNFFVSNHGFLIHKGFKEMDKFHGTKDQENKHNKIIYRQVKRELIQRYPESNRKC